MRNFKCWITRTISYGFASLLASLIYVSGANAVDYYWYYWNSPSVHYSSAQAACDTNVDSANELNALAISPNGLILTCQYKRKSDGFLYTSQFDRGGTECTAPAVWNSTTGSCEGPEPDPCESGAGGDVWHEHRVGNLDGTGGRTEPPGVICESSCQAAFSGEVAADCYRYVATGDLNGAFCKYKYKFNGVSCTGSGPSNFDQPSTKPPTVKEPSSFGESSCDTWTTKPDGTRTRDCTSVAENKEPGSMDCPAGMGPLVCTPTKPYPNYDKTEKERTENQKDNPDGSSESSTTTTTTTTKCRGSLACTSESKTETSSDNTNADGTPGDSTSSCNGAGCKDDSEGDGEGDDGDDNEDKGECDPIRNPEGCESEDEESSVSGDGSCDAPPACDGDAIQCAILRQEHKNSCDQEKWQEIDEDEISQGVQGDLTGPEFEELEPEAPIDVGTMLDTSSFLGGSCPAVEAIPVSFGGVSESVEVPMGELCPYLQAFGYLLVAFAVWRATGIVAGGMS